MTKKRSDLNVMESIMLMMKQNFMKVKEKKESKIVPLDSSREITILKKKDKKKKFETQTVEAFKT
jgi:hypothetical protein